MGSSSMKSTVIAAIVFGLVVLCAVAARHFSGWGSSSDDWDRGRTEATQAIQEADALWGSGKTPEAIAAYKRILRDDPEALRYSFVLDTSKAARLFRRVIEYELQYGDKGEARDYMNEAITYYGLQRNLTMDTPEGKQLLEDVTGNVGTQSSWPSDGY